VHRCQQNLGPYLATTKASLPKQNRMESQIRCCRVCSCDRYLSAKDCCRLKYNPYLQRVTRRLRAGSEVGSCSVTTYFSKELLLKLDCEQNPVRSQASHRNRVISACNEKHGTICLVTCSVHQPRRRRKSFDTYGDAVAQKCEHRSNCLSD
jgi:hypothetical protein